MNLASLESFPLSYSEPVAQESYICSLTLAVPEP